MNYVDSAMDLDGLSTRLYYEWSQLSWPMFDGLGERLPAAQRQFVELHRGHAVELAWSAMGVRDARCRTCPPELAAQGETQ